MPISTEASPPPEEASIEPLTPELAEKLLEANKGNRPINMTQVENLARLMKEGLWRFNGDAIRIAVDGTLLDGQHRCMACVISEVTQPMQLFVRGLQNETQATMDQGRKRTAADVLSMAGIPGGNQIASVARMVDSWKNGKRNISELSKQAKNALTNDEVRMWAERDPNLAIAAKLSLATPMKAICNQKASGALWFLLNEADPERCARFFELVQSGAGLQKGNPILTLRNFWMNLRVQKGATPVARYFDAGVRAWNRWVLDEQLTLITQRLEREVPDIVIPDLGDGLDTVNRWPGSKAELHLVQTIPPVVDKKPQPEPEAPQEGLEAPAAPVSEDKPKPKPVRRRKPPVEAVPEVTGSLFAER